MQIKIITISIYVNESVEDLTQNIHPSTKFSVIFTWHHRRQTQWTKRISTSVIWQLPFRDVFLTLLLLVLMLGRSDDGDLPTFSFLVAHTTKATLYQQWNRKYSDHPFEENGLCRFEGYRRWRLTKKQKNRPPKV